MEVLTIYRTLAYELWDWQFSGEQSVVAVILLRWHMR